MEFFEHPYYILNKRLLSLVGEWPGLSSNQRRFRTSIVNFLMYSFGFVEVALIVSSGGEMEAFLETLAPLSALGVCFIKFYTVHFNQTKIKNLLNRIVSNWNMWRSKEELDIMHKFGRQGKAFTFWYTIYIYSCMTLFLVLPFVPRLMDQIVPLNESRPLRPIFKSEYFINEEEHFLSVYIHMSIVIVAAISVLIATDCLFLLLNCHICGVFAALGHSLENMLEGQLDQKYSLEHLSSRQNLRNIAYSVKVHNKALEFAELIESSYSISLLQQAGLSMLCMSISLFQILMTLEKPSEAFRYIAFAAAQLVHLLCMCYPGQRMIDYSTEIQFKAYSGLWYNAPSDESKLVILILRRSMEPTYLTAGKIFIFCLESFSSILQSATSYFMVLASFN